MLRYTEVKSTIVDNRRELTQYFDLNLRKIKKEMKADQKLKKVHTVLKTYIVESNLFDEDKNPDFSKIPQVDGYTQKIISTNDDTLKRYDVSRLDNNKIEVTNRYYIDAINPRFWAFHTIEKSDETNIFMNKLINKPISGLDTPWFTNKYNEKMRNTDGFIFKGFSLKYGDIFEKEKEDDLSVSTLSMRLQGSRATKAYELLNQSEFKNNVNLSSIRIKYIDEDNRDEFITEEISSRGRFSARGTSFVDHLYILNKFKKVYEEKIQNVESCWQSMGKDDYGYKFNGAPLNIILDREIPNLKEFLIKILSSSEPFRLWGLYKFINDNYAKAKVVDLHTGDQLTLEVSNKWIRVYLPYNSCGNTVIRLCYFIQRFYDSKAKLNGGDYGEII